MDALLEAQDHYEIKDIYCFCCHILSYTSKVINICLHICKDPSALYILPLFNTSNHNGQKGSVHHILYFVSECDWMFLLSAQSLGRILRCFINIGPGLSNVHLHQFRCQMELNSLYSFLASFPQLIITYVIPVNTHVHRHFFIIIRTLHFLAELYIIVKGIDVGVDGWKGKCHATWAFNDSHGVHAHKQCEGITIIFTITHILHCISSLYSRG